MLDNKNLYNDKELIDEGDLDWTDYGFRMYDAQIGRFPQLDPLTDEYPHYTPYQYAGNEPIANIDIDGLEPGTSIVSYTSQAALDAALQASLKVAHDIGTVVVKGLPKVAKTAAKASISWGKAALLVGKAAVQVGAQLIKGAAEDAIHGATYVATAVESGAVNTARELYYEGVHEGDAYDKKRAYTQKIWGFSWERGLYVSYDWTGGGGNTDDAARGAIGFAGIAGTAEAIGALRNVLIKFAVKATVERGVSVIGTRATYREFAKKIGANFLDVTDEAWSYRKNVEFLQGVVKRGDDVIFAGKFDATKLNQRSVLAQEIRYLIKRGYSWNKDFTRLIKK